MYGQFSAARASGTFECPTIESGAASNSWPSRMRTASGWAQSRQRASMRTSLPGKSQLTASDSSPHCPYHFCCPSTVMAYWVGRLENGEKPTM